MGGGGLALVLSGGGARAAYQVGVLAAIAERSPEVSFPVITGVSAGAINAAYLAGHPGPLRSAVEGLRAEWERLTSKMIYGVRPTSLVRLAGRWVGQEMLGRRGDVPPLRGLLDTHPLREFLAACIPFDGIDANVASGRLRAVALSATAYESGWTVTFVHGEPSIPMWERARRLSVRVRLALDHVMASSAIPIIFPAVRLEDGFYGDGSVRQTSPLAPAIHLGALRVISIGSAPTPARPPLPTGDRRYPSTAEAMGLLLDSIFLDALDADAERVTRTNRLLAAMPPGIPPPDGLKPIELLMLRPSRDLGSIADEFGDRLPRSLGLLFRAFGGHRRGGSEFLSYLLFEREYTSRLVELGYADTRAEWPRLERFLLAPAR